MIFWSWVIVMVSIPGAGGRGAVPARGENRAPPPGTHFETNNDCQIKCKLLHFILVSDRRALLRSRRLCGVELPVALLDTASPGVPGNGDPDMVRANPLACRGDFLLCLARCQGEDLIAEARRRAFAGDWSRGRGAAAPASARRGVRPR